MIGNNERTTWEFRSKGNLDEKLGGINRRFDRMEKKSSRFEEKYNKRVDRKTKKTRKWKDSLHEVGGEFPMIGRAASALKSPMGMAAIAIGGVGLALNKAGNELKAFDRSFLELKNLNLDKTESEIESLRESVLDVSMEKALDPKKTAKAFFDVQSSTGKYGKEVEKLVGRIGEFSMAVKSDFNTTIEGASKAMDTFGLGAKDIDKFLESSAKTVQVGVTTFDQLAEVQTEFSGAAAAAGQSFDEANKLFAMFSKTSKNVDIAATMTKGTFEDLSKLENIGIKVFGDDGQWRNLERIVGDVNEKFKKMNAAEIDNLIKKVGGNEGLRGMLKNVQNQGDKVLATFDQFDKTDFAIEDAIENANDDLSTMEEKISNQLSNAWIRLGEAAKPFLLGMKKALLSFVEMSISVVDNFRTLFGMESWQKQQNLKKGQMLGKKSAKESVERAKERLLDKFMPNTGNVSNFSKMASGGNIDQSSVNPFANRNENLRFARSRIDRLEKEIEKQKNTKVYYREGADVEKMEANRVQALEKDKGELKVLKDFIRKGGDLRVLGMKDNKIDPDGGKSPKSRLEEASKSSSLPDSSAKKDKEHVAGIMSGKERVRNVRVNINNLVRELQVNSKTVQGGAQEVQSVITDTIIRAVRDSEMTLSQG